MIFRKLTLILTVAVFGMTSEAQAALSYSTGATSTFSGASGNTISVPIYLRDTAGTIQVATDGGLFSAGFLVQRSTPVPAIPAAITSANINVGSFDTVDTALSSYSATTAAIFEYQSDNPAPATPTAGYLQLGTITIKLPSLADQTTLYTIGDIDPTTTQFVTYNGNDLDALIASGAFSVTSNAVPEPFGLSVLGAGAGLLRRRR